MWSSLLPSVALLATFASAQQYAEPSNSTGLPYQTGFNLGTRDASGNCKTQDQWAQEFSAIQQFDAGQFDRVKLFTTSDCDALNTAIPAAEAAGFQIWTGVWAFPDDERYGAEREALQRALSSYGTDWLAGINVGSEALYRNEIPPEQLVDRILDIKELVQQTSGGAGVPVGTADTWTAWVNPANQPVIEASDIIMMNAFPYWQGATAEQGLGTFQAAIDATRGATGNKPFIVGETGWPTAGQNFGNAVPSLENAQLYWTNVACYLQSQQIPFYWFQAFDEPQKGTDDVEGNFGVANAEEQLKIDLSC